MYDTILRTLRSGKGQLNLIGIGLLVLLALSAWDVTHPLSIYSLLPLILIGYAAFRIIFELTYNRANVPTLATSYAGRGKIAQIIKDAAEARPDKAFNVIDLGSGRGELAQRIARAIPKGQVLGIELNRIPYLQACFMQRLLRVRNLAFKQIDFWGYDCSNADGVVMFLNQRLATKAGEKLHKELKPGSIIISHTFPLLGTWTPTDTVEFRTPFKEVIYVYRKD
jgi:SAM-dependent methyltransferase